MKLIMSLFIKVLLGASLTTSVKEPSNKHFWNTVETSASAAQIWDIWTKVPEWKKWDIGLKDAMMEEAFELGNKGTIVSLENRKSKFKIVEMEEGKSYTFKTNLPLGGLYVKRFLEEKNGKTFFTHEVWFKGLTAGIFAKVFGPKFRKMLPEAMNNIKQLAE